MPVTYEDVVLFISERCRASEDLDDIDREIACYMENLGRDVMEDILIDKVINHFGRAPES